jgi:XTP/dITP diphosphohydrolase
MMGAAAVRELWVASDNTGKIAEIERLLAPLGYRLRAQREVPGFAAVAEDRPDFAGNALAKAAALARAVGACAVADDSGLCVDALDGRPGVHSARWAGPHADDRARIAKLLDALRDVPPARRTARFVCHVRLADPRGASLAGFEAACEGSIANAPRGTGGFGYDPIFIPRETAVRSDPPTFAMLTAADKDAISHRGKALRLLAGYLAEHPLPAAAPERLE